MKYKIAFFSENNFEGKVPRNHSNMRVDMAWISSLDADHYNIFNWKTIIDKNKNYDIAIFILPKNKFYDFPKDYITLKTYCNKIGIMQEGPSWYWESKNVIEQQNYLYTLVTSIDFILCHNDIDKKYFEGITWGSKPVYKLPTLLIEDSIKNIKIKQEDKTIIGGNFTEWYGGFPSFIVSSYFENKVFAPQMGRMKSDEKTVNGLFHLPYMNWLEWMKTLSTFKYGVHLMRTYAAGTFALNCAYFGIPCIGYESLDTQRLCHNSTTIKDGDIVLANKIAKRLKTDKNFYSHCSHRCQTEYKKLYSESNFLQHMKSVFDNLLNI